ncbi:TonB-dependent receptor [Novacetimonas hansenii]|uniref:TonB-dependent receptor n=1 Tax=Novacetimonas hansenii TaxID=436 RepID=UPI0017846A8D|nr:TonB-dependent receptor [Novacetimonas hansenii]QOF95479.1 TonB-dependent receptor [Novacetimonas hansenii]
MSNPSRRPASWKAFSCLFPIVMVGVQLGQTALAEGTETKKNLHRKSDRTSASHAVAATGGTKAQKDKASSRDQDNSQSKIEKIHVTAKKSPETQQLNAKNDVSIADAKFIESHPDNNIAETLARLPGVNVLSTTIGGSIGGSSAMIDNASRGEGQFLSVRGIGPDYTQSLIDGVNVANAKPASRQLQLSLMPPLGFSQAVVNKTGQASDSGEWVSGFVDFQTLNAFDVGHDVLSLKTRGEFMGKGYQYGTQHSPFNGGGTVQGEYSHIFGRNRQFGIHAVGYYQSRSFTSLTSNENEGNWDVINSLTGSDHTPTPNIPITQNLTPAQINPQLSYGNSQRYGGNLAFDWHGENATIFVRGSYASSNTSQTTVQRGLQSTNQNWVLQPNGTYNVQEVGVVGSYYLDTNPEIQNLGIMQAGFTLDHDWLHSKTTAFGSLAEDDEDSVNLAYKNFNLDPSGNSLTLSPSYIGSPGTPTIALNASQLAKFNNLSNYVPQTNSNWGFGGVEETKYKNNQSLWGLKQDFSADTNLSFLKKILFGAKYYDTYRTATNRDYTYDNSDGYLPGMADSLASSGFINGSTRIGNYVTPLMNAGEIRDYLHSVPLSYASASYGGNWTGSAAQTAYNANANTQMSSESVTAAYIALPFDFDKVQITPGLRYEHADIRNKFWDASYDDSGNISGGHFAKNRTSYNEFLPSLFIAYRPTPFSVYRASFDTSYVMPNTFLLGGSRTSTYDGNGVYTIQEGNPNLKPVLSRNFDLSGQWMSRDGSSFAMGGFYKLLSNYLFDAGNSTRTDGTHYLSSTATTNVSPQEILETPRNGGSAFVYGLEMSGIKNMSFLPGFWKHLFISGNVTLQRSHANLKTAGIPDGTPIQYAPNWMYNLSLGYQSGRLNTNLSFRRSGAFLETYYTYSNSNGKTFNISWWDQPIQRLDYSINYKLTKRISMGFSAQNLLGDVSYYATRGKNSEKIPQIVWTGRSYFLNMNVDF